MFKSFYCCNVLMNLRNVVRNVRFFFQFVVFCLEYRELMYSLRRSIFDREYRGLLRENLSLCFINIFLESRNFLLKRWYAFRREARFFLRSLYYFTFHGIILLRDDDPFDIVLDEERAVCVCLNPFDVIAVALARHLFFGALPILGDVPEVRGDIK